MKNLTSSTMRAPLHLIVTALLLFASALLSLALFSPVQAQSQGASPNSPATNDAGTMPMMGPMMGAMTSTMSMAEMGAKMDEMMAHMASMMASMPMSGTSMMGEGMMGDGMMGGMSMHDMGMMMQMMGMMHHKMGQMQMMMGAMMSGDMMGAKMMGEGMMKNGMMGNGGMGGGGMMGDGMMGGATPQPESGTPSASATAVPTATVDHSAHQAGGQSQDAAEDKVEDAAEDATKDDAKDAVEEQAEGEAVDHSAHPAPAMVAAPQSAAGGAVTVEATPLTTDDVLDVAFAVTLETHSVELDFDLAERATLTIGEATFPATSWEPDAADGHHVSGILRFTIDHPAHGALYDVEHLTLELHEIDGAHVALTFPLDK